MSDVLTRTVAPLVANTSKRLGVELPQSVQDDLAAAKVIREARRTVIGQDEPSLAGAVAAAVSAGKDPLASKEVQRALMLQQLDAANIDARLTNHADNLAAEAVIRHAAEIIDTWRPTVGRVNQALTELRKLAPGIDLTDDSAITRLPVAALTPWGRAKESAAHLDVLVKGWQVLAQAAGTRVTAQTRPLILAGLSYQQVQQLGPNTRTEDVIAIDVPLELADLDTFAARLEQLGEGRREAQAYDAAAPDRQREERRRLHGIAVKIPGGMVQIP